MTIICNSLNKSYKRKQLRQNNIWLDFFQPRYENIPAIIDLTFRVEQGDFIGLIGPNGAGKSTLIKILTGILCRDSGDVVVIGYDPFTHKSSFKRQIALIAGQKTQLWWDLPALDSYNLIKEIYQIKNGDYQTRLRELVNLLDIDSLIHVPVRQLSLGERIKAEIVGGLLHAPNIIFLDEPTIALDLTSQHHIREFLKAYNAKTGATIFLTSHYVRDIENTCQRILLLNKGNLYFDGSITELRQKGNSYKVISVQVTRNDLFWLTQPEVRFTEPDMAKIQLPIQLVDEFLAQVTKTGCINNISVDDESIEDMILRVYESFK